MALTDRSVRAPLVDQSGLRPSGQECPRSFGRSVWSASEINLAGSHAARW